jgi:hypothetical protein
MLSFLGGKGVDISPVAIIKKYDKKTAPKNVMKTKAVKQGVIFDDSITAAMELTHGKRFRKSPMVKRKR